MASPTGQPSQWPTGLPTQYPTAQFVYSPWYAARMAHSWERFGHSNEFDPDNDTYWDSMIWVPTIIFGVVLVCLFYYFSKPFWSLLCYCRCCFCCRFHLVPVVESDVDLTKEKIEYIERQRILMKFAFAVLFVYLFFVNHGFFVGNEYITDGINRAISSLDWVSEFIVSLSDVGKQIVIETNLIATNIEQSRATCALTDTQSGEDLIEFIRELRNATMAFNDILDGVPASLDSVQEDMTYYAIELKDVLIFLVYAFVLCILLIYGFAYWLRSRCFITLNVAISGGIVLCISAACCFQMYVLMAFGDFCQNPTGYVADNIGPLKYYLTCSGGNALEKNINDAFIIAKELIDNLYQFTKVDGLCPANAELSEAKLHVDHILAEIEKVVELLLSCGPVQYQWSQVIEVGLCQEALTGIYGIFVCQFMVAGTVFALAVVSNILGTHWDKLGHVHIGMVVPVDTAATCIDGDTQPKGDLSLNVCDNATKATFHTDKHNVELLAIDSARSVANDVGCPVASPVVCSSAENAVVGFEWNG